MKFTVNRKMFLEYLKSIIRIVPKSSPVKELTGFLIEANEDDGYLYVTATDLDTAVQRKLKPVVETGGKFVMKAKPLVDILDVLDGTDVVFKEIKPGVIEIKGGSCVYTMHVLSAGTYPRPELPFPDATVKVTGIKQLYAKTCAVAAKEEVSYVLSGIHIEIKPESLRAVSCDSKGIAMSSRESSCGGNLSFTIPKVALSYLAAAIENDDELEVGINGPFVTFMKDSLLFSTKRLMKEYVNVDGLFDSFNSTYAAKVDFHEFKDRITNICNMALIGSEASYIKIRFKENKIEIGTQNDIGSGYEECGAVMIDGQECCFYYPANMLKDIFKTVEGTLIIQVDRRGYLLVFDKFNKYMMTPIREEFAEKQAKKLAEKKQTGKSKSKTKTKAKAA